MQDYGALLDGLDIPGETFLVRLNEFQRRGFYLAFLVECPPRKQRQIAERQGSPACEFS